MNLLVRAAWASSLATVRKNMGLTPAAVSEGVVAVGDIRMMCSLL